MRKLFAGRRIVILAIALSLTGCEDRTNVTIGDVEKVDFAAAMVPVARTCAATPIDVPGFSASAELHWLGGCDVVRIRWTLAFLGPAFDGDRLDICNLLPNQVVSPVWLPKVKLVEFPADLAGAMESDDSVDEYPAYQGCDPRNDLVPPGFPLDFSPTQDARLELQLDLGDVSAVGEPPLRIARVGSMPRTMEARVMIAECIEFEIPGDADSRCLRQNHKWQVKVGVGGSARVREDFSPHLRVRSVRILRGRQVARPLPGIEGSVSPAGDGSQPLLTEFGFDCKRSPDNQCIAVRQQFVEVADEGARCYSDANIYEPQIIDLVNSCRDVNGDPSSPVIASPGEFPLGFAAGARPEWTARFSEQAGFPPPALDEGNDEVLAIEFTLESF